MKPYYYDIWTDYESLKNDYPEAPPAESIVYAGYSYEDHSGAALVVFIRDGKVFENNDGHCSCNGLEHWDPEETLIGALRMRTGWPGLQEQLDLLDKEPTHA